MGKKKYEQASTIKSMDRLDGCYRYGEPIMLGDKYLSWGWWSQIRYRTLFRLVKERRLFFVRRTLESLLEEEERTKRMWEEVREDGGG